MLPQLSIHFAVIPHAADREKSIAARGGALQLFAMNI